MSKREIVYVDPTMRIRRLSVGVIVNKDLKGVDEESVRKIVSAAFRARP